MKKTFCKIPLPEFNNVPSAITPHSEPVNTSISNLPQDFGLKPNGVTIEDMRSAPELFGKQDLLDKAGVCAHASGALSKDVAKAVNTLSKLPNSHIKKTTKSI